MQISHCEVSNAETGFPKFNLLHLAYCVVLLCRSLHKRWTCLNQFLSDLCVVQVTLHCEMTVLIPIY